MHTYFFYQQHPHWIPRPVFFLQAAMEEASQADERDDQEENVEDAGVIKAEEQITAENEQNVVDADVVGGTAEAVLLPAIPQGGTEPWSAHATVCIPCYTRIASVRIYGFI